MTKMIQTPLTEAVARELQAGDQVLINGIIYTGRDAAHKKMIELIAQGRPLPMEVKDQIIYYVGPCPAKPNQAIGSAGPTTSGRMDAFAPTLMRLGLRGMIGKGLRNQAVVQCMQETGSIYFAAIGGAGALLAQAIKKADIIAFPELGAEAVYKLQVENFPVTVVIDCEGNDLYAQGKAHYRTVRD